MAKIKTENIDKVITELVKSGITNKISIAAILSIISKESGFIPQREIAYSNTSNTRIKEIFSKTRNLNDQELTNLKKDPVKFFNFVYGGKYGNAANEGYKYRGGGFNQLTFKDNYKFYSDLLKLDLVADPELLNNANIAARVVAAYFNRQFEKNKTTILKRYGAKNINDFKDTKTAVNAFYNANAGLAKDTSNITSQGKTEALNKVDSLLNVTTNLIKDNPGSFLGGLILIGGLLYFTR